MLAEYMLILVQTLRSFLYSQRIEGFEKAYQISNPFHTSFPLFSYIWCKIFGKPTN